MYSKKSMSIRGVEEHSTQIDLYIDIIENEVIRILEKDVSSRNSEEVLILDYARRFYGSLYKNRKLTAISCKIYKKKELILELFSDSELKEIKNYKEKVSNRAHEYYNKFMRGESLNEIEQSIMFEFLTSCIGAGLKNIYNAQKNVVKKLLTQEDNYHITGKNFLLQFITHEKCKKNNLSDAMVYIGNSDFWGRDFNFGGCYYGGTGLIIVKEDIVKKFSLENNRQGVASDVSMIHTMFHELEHYKQNCITKNGVINISSINNIINVLSRKYLTDKDFDEYMKNYFFMEKEREANIVGWNETAYFLKEYGNKEKNRDLIKSISNKVNAFLEKSYSLKKTKDGVRVRAEEYNIDNLVNIIKNNPGELQEYPQLKLFFNDNGSRKSLYDIIREYSKIRFDKSIVHSKQSDLMDVYEIFLSPFFSKTNDLSVIKIEQFNEEEKISLFALIVNEYFKEIKKLKSMLDIYDGNKEKYLNFIAYSCVENIKKYYYFLKSNEQVIHDLYNRNNIFVYHLNIKNLDEELMPFESRINRMDNIANTAIGKKISELSYLMEENKYGRKS